MICCFKQRGKETVKTVIYSILINNDTLICLIFLGVQPTKHFPYNLFALLIQLAPSSFK